MDFVRIVGLYKHMIMIEWNNKQRKIIYQNPKTFKVGQLVIFEKGRVLHIPKQKIKIRPWRIFA